MCCVVTVSLCVRCLNRDDCELMAQNNSITSCSFTFLASAPLTAPHADSADSSPADAINQCLLLIFFLWQGSDSEYEVDPNRQKTHSFVNHYISDPTYYNSWRRQQKGISRAQAYSYTESESGDPDHCAPPPLPPLPPLPPQLSSPSPQPQQAQGQPQGQGSLFRPKGSRTPTPSQQSSNPPSQHSTLYRPPSSLAPGSRAPIAGFSSFVWKCWKGHQKF